MLCYFVLSQMSPSPHIHVSPGRGFQMPLWLVCLWPAMWAVLLQMLGSDLGFSITGRQESQFTHKWTPFLCQKQRQRESRKYIPRPGKRNVGPGREQVMQPASGTLACERHPAHTSLHSVGNRLALKHFETLPDIWKMGTDTLRTSFPLVC